jgi:hypothetical protein
MVSRRCSIALNAYAGRWTPPAARYNPFMTDPATTTAAAWSWPMALAATAAVGSAIAALVSASSAWQQRNLSKEKLKLDLFDRRYAIYKAVNRYIAHAMQHSNITDEALRELDRGTSSIEFLFGDTLRAHVTEVRNKGLALMTARSEMEPLPVGTERSKQAQIIHDLGIWFSAQFKETEVAFAKYLRFPEPR